MSDRSLSRRELVERGLGGLAALGLGAAAGCGGQAASGESGTSSTFLGPLRVLSAGYGVDAALKRAAERDLGFQVFFDIADAVSSAERVTTQPDSFDVYDGYPFQFNSTWPAENLRPIETGRITRWSEISPLLKLGKVEPNSQGCTYGDGGAPFRNLYADPARSGRWRSPPTTDPGLRGELVEWLDEKTGRGAGDEPTLSSELPSTFGFDAPGYNGDVLRKEPEDVSWAEYFNPTWRGRVALIDHPTLALQEAGMAARALGLMAFSDLGNPTKQEIDGLIKILLDLQKRGQFAKLWSGPDEAIDLMSSGKVVIETMWYPTLVVLQAQRFPVRYAAPREGFRAWSEGLSIAARATDPVTLEACYAYLNWWLSGPPGATLMRLGYYSPVQETTRQFTEPGEYAYWIEGKPADKDYPGPFGGIAVRKGQVRDGGSFAERACRIGVWNSVFTEFDYAYARWQELVAA